MSSDKVYCAICESYIPIQEVEAHMEKECGIKATSVKVDPEEMFKPTFENGYTFEEVKEREKMLQDLNKQFECQP